MSKFYDKKEIFDKALKFYNSAKFFIDFIEDIELFPLEIKLKKLKQNELRENYSQVLNELKSFYKVGFDLEFREFNFKSIGFQKLPVGVHFKSRQNLLKFISKSDEFDEFSTLYKDITLKYPILKTIILKKPFIILEHKNVWSRLLLVCDFFINNAHANIYIRELSIEGIDTKFIEKYKKILDTLLSVLLPAEAINSEIVSLSNYGFEKKYFLKYPQPTIRFRILDDTQNLCKLSDITLTIDEFKDLELACEKVFIIENKITTLSFPKLKSSIVIFGSGYGVEVLKDVKWLSDKEVFYWGDIDTDGFAILSQARGYFKQIKSIFMDEKTIKLFKKYSTKAKLPTQKELKNLTYNEDIVYQNILKNKYGQNFRIEQEKLIFSYVKKTLNGL